MDALAKMTSKGQVTVPKSVRDALELGEGDSLLFRVEGKKAVVSKTANFLDLAGSVTVPPGKEGASWERIKEETWADRARRRR